MILLSYNARGIGPPLKKLALKRLVLSLDPDVILP
jgi:hypothetical protein